MLYTLLLKNIISYSVLFLNCFSNVTYLTVGSCRPYWCRLTEEDREAGYKLQVLCSAFKQQQALPAARL